jgi:hypothetical protein
VNLGFQGIPLVDSTAYKGARAEVERPVGMLIHLDEI